MRFLPMALLLAVTSTASAARAVVQEKVGFYTRAVSTGVDHRGRKVRTTRNLTGLGEGGWTRSVDSRDGSSVHAHLGAPGAGRKGVVIRTFRVGDVTVERVTTAAKDANGRWQITRRTAMGELHGAPAGMSAADIAAEIRDAIAHTR